MSTFPDYVQKELVKARAKHPRAFNSMHEGYAIILEEIEELKLEIFKKQENRNRLDTLTELVQIGAMVQRLAEDVVIGEKFRK
jgi:hypothetical protein